METWFKVGIGLILIGVGARAIYVQEFTWTRKYKEDERAPMGSDGYKRTQLTGLPAIIIGIVLVFAGLGVLLGKF